MVARKPVGSPQTQKPTEQARIPYPASPTTPTEQGIRPPTLPSMFDAGEGWEDVGRDENLDGTPMSSRLQAGVTRQPTRDGMVEPELPLLLKAGHPEVTPRSSFDSQSSAELFPQSHDLQHESSREPSPKPAYSMNPYHRARSAERAARDVPLSQEESSVDIWAELEAPPPPPTHPPPPPPLLQHDLGGFEDLSVSDHHIQSKAADSAPSLSYPAASYEEDSLISFNNAEQYQAEIAGQPLPFTSNTVRGQYEQYPDQTGWMDHAPEVPSNAAPPINPPINSDSSSFQHHHILSDRLDSTNNFLPPLPKRPVDGLTPELPPRKSQEGNAPPTQPPRPPPTRAPNSVSATGPLRSDAETSQARTTRQRSETYQIKHITWVDASNNTRTSPIMVQNANGPCPLLALVNALTLSTPMNVNTVLVDTLRIREQVTLGLLIDAVFEELMSGRRGDAAQELPDVGELYTFLVTLHTGMNVNPRFVPTGIEPDLIDFNGPKAPAAITSDPQFGGFEETREMKLYSTFSIPLIHGWIPSPANAAYAALQRSAKTYEDAQNLMFREEELEDKLQTQGLNHQEQTLLEDITSIKYFLSTSATQLTIHGLNTITNALRPGSVAILFRNDHFSTLYRHPRSGQLLTLVTDMGYAGHEEVVWESLVDVSGEGSEFFAGDFRPVGNNAGDHSTQPLLGPDDGQGWTTVTHKPIHSKPQKLTTAQSSSATSLNPQRLPTPPLNEEYDLPTSPNTEQEDHDLALALQLQEEEDDRSRREAAARRREDELSQAYLDSQPPPVQPPRNNPRAQPQAVRPMVPPRGGSNTVNPTRRAPARLDPEAGEDAPPPTYEQAAKAQPYIPPAGQSFSPPTGSPPTPVTRPSGARPRQMSAYSQHASSMGNLPSTASAHRRSVAGRAPANVSPRGGLGGLDGAQGLARRRSAGVGAGASSWDEDAERRDKDCIVM